MDIVDRLNAGRRDRPEGQSLVSDVEDREVLLLDDWMMELVYNTRILERGGWTVLGAAQDGKTGIQTALTIRPSLVITDFDHPGPSGLEVARRIKESLAVPVLVYSGYIDAESLEEVPLESAIDWVLLKPGTGTLLERARIELDRYARGRALWDIEGLFRAARVGTPEEVRTLCAAGARTDARSPKGRTPLMHAAVFTRDPGVIQVLLEAGTDPGARDARGLDSMDLAASNPESGVRRVLEEVLGRGAADRPARRSTWKAVSYNMGVPLVDLDGDLEDIPEDRVFIGPPSSTESPAPPGTLPG